MDYLMTVTQAPPPFLSVYLCDKMFLLYDKLFHLLRLHGLPHDRHPGAPANGCGCVWVREGGCGCVGTRACGCVRVRVGACGRAGAALWALLSPARKAASGPPPRPRPRRAAPPSLSSRSPTRPALSSPCPLLSSPCPVLSSPCPPSLSLSPPLCSLRSLPSFSPLLAHLSFKPFLQGVPSHTHYDCTTQTGVNVCVWCVCARMRARAHVLVRVFAYARARAGGDAVRVGRARRRGRGRARRRRGAPPT